MADSDPHNQFDLYTEDSMVSDDFDAFDETKTIEDVAIREVIQNLSSEMRCHPRKAFHFRQLVAPLRNGLMPWPEDFVEVECRDISQGGISLFLKRPPGFEDFVICLGPQESHIRLFGRVVRVQKIDSDGRSGYLVGCQFVERDQ